METPVLERDPEAPEQERDPTETPPDQPATPEPEGPNWPQDDPAPDDAALEDLHMEGDEGYLSTDFGGKAPTDSKLQIVGRAIAIEGQLKKGTTIRATIELKVGGGRLDDKEDSQTGQVVACTRKHYARIVGFTRQS